jgi:hypothetical protein
MRNEVEGARVKCNGAAWLWEALLRMHTTAMMPGIGHRNACTSDTITLVTESGTQEAKLGGSTKRQDPALAGAHPPLIQGTRSAQCSSVSLPRCRRSRFACVHVDHLFTGYVALAVILTGLFTGLVSLRLARLQRDLPRSPLATCCSSAQPVASRTTSLWTTARSH